MQNQVKSLPMSHQLYIYQWTKHFILRPLLPPKLNYVIDCLEISKYHKSKYSFLVVKEWNYHEYGKKSKDHLGVVAALVWILVKLMNLTKDLFLPGLTFCGEFHIKKRLCARLSNNQKFGIIFRGNITSCV